MRMRTLFVLVSLVIALNFAVSPAAAVTNGTPDVYKVTIKKFEISNDNGTTFTELGSGGLIFDIAAVNAGAAVGTYFSSSAPLLANTTYNRMRVTVNCTFTLKGCVGASCTQSGTNAPGAAPAVESSFTIPVSACPTGEFVSTSPAVAFITNASGGLQLTMKFDVTNALALYAAGELGPGSTVQILPGSPSVNVTSP